MQQRAGGLKSALAENETLRVIAKDLHWMARRYADGRQSYAPSLFNEHTRKLLDLGVKLNPTGDGTIWAHDRMGRVYDGLTPEEAAMEAGALAAQREAIAKALEAAGCRCYEKIIGTELRVRTSQAVFDKDYLGKHPYVWIDDVRHDPWCPRAFANRIRSGEIG